MSEITWESFNRETYRRVNADPLSSEFRCRTPGEYPIAIVSLFSVESLGARALYAFMKEAGFDVDLIFLKEHALNNFKMPSAEEVQLFMDLLRERRYKLVGIGLRSSYIRFTMELTERIKRELEIPVVWGGTAGTVTPELTLKAGADYAINNEAEEAFSELVNALSNGEDPGTILNLWYRGADGEPKNNPNRPLIANLDRLPIQDLEDDNKFFIDRDTLHRGDPWRNVIKFETLTARGCPYICSFCIHSYLVELNKGLGKSVNSASVEHVVREIEYAKSKLPRMKSIFFADEVFGTSTKWVRDFTKAYQERCAMPFELAIDPRALNDEKVGLLMQAGLAELNMGIQSGSEQVRRELYDRPVSDKRLLEVAGLMKKHGVFTRYDIIVDNPFESSEDKRKTLELLLRLPRPFILNMYSLNYFPGAKLTDYAVRKGIIKEEQIEGQSEKSLKQFTVSFDYPRSTEDTLWNALYSLSSKWFVPRPLLRRLADLRWPRKHPAPIVALAQCASRIRLVFNGLQLLYEGRIDFHTIRRYAGSIGSITR